MSGVTARSALLNEAEPYSVSDFAVMYVLMSLLGTTEAQSQSVMCSICPSVAPQSRKNSLTATLWDLWKAWKKLLSFLLGVFLEDKSSNRKRVVPYMGTWAIKQLPEMNQSCKDGTLSQLIGLQDLLQPGGRVAAKLPNWKGPGSAAQQQLNMSQCVPRGARRPVVSWLVSAIMWSAGPGH